MIAEKCKCKTCGRPLPTPVEQRCDACKADRNAKIGGVIKMAGLVIVLGLGHLVKKLFKGRVQS
jgi:hypothetical protein